VRACLVTNCSPFSNQAAVGIDLFTDPELIAQSTTIKAVHVIELRDAIDQARARHALTAFPWTDAVLVPGVTTAKAVHVLEMRTALTAAYDAAGRPQPTYAETVAALLEIKASHLMELRDLVLSLD
jgi:hypothetical protein